MPGLDPGIHAPNAQGLGMPDGRVMCGWPRFDKKKVFLGSISGPFLRPDQGFAKAARGAAVNTAIGTAGGGAKRC